MIDVLIYAAVGVAVWSPVLALMLLEWWGGRGRHPSACRCDTCADRRLDIRLDALARRFVDAGDMSVDDYEANVERLLMERDGVSCGRGSELRFGPGVVIPYDPTGETELYVGRYP